MPPMEFHTGGGIPVSQPRRPSNPPFQPQMRPVNNPNLQFMSFDVGSAPSSFAPPPSYRGNSFGAFEDEPPLLEELGINTRLITKKTLNLLNPFRVNPNLHENADLSGPFFVLHGIWALPASSRKASLRRNFGLDDSRFPVPLFCVQYVGREKW